MEVDEVGQEGGVGDERVVVKWSGGLLGFIASGSSANAVPSWCETGKGEETGLVAWDDSDLATKF